MLRIAAAALLATAGPALALAIDATAQATAIEYGKNLRASALEESLPGRPLAEWLAQTLAVKQLEWFISDCDMMSNARQVPERRLLCIGARASDQGRIYLRFHLVVGNWAHGVAGKPYILRQSFAACNPPTLDTVDSTQPFDRLTELSRIAERLKDICQERR